MVPDKVIYTDGRDVTVTESTLKVKQHAYDINGITKLSMWTIRPERWPAVLLLLLGIGVALCGFMGLIPADMNFQTQNGLISGNAICLWSGIALAVIGLVWLISTHERYAVRIATAEGEKNAVVSSKREYIQQIVNALNKSFDFENRYTTTTRRTAVIK